MEEFDHASVIGPPSLEGLRQDRPHPFPTDVLIETAAHCNLDCIMCPQGKLKRPRGRMSAALWEKLVDEIAAVSPETRIWPALMGEPLLLGDGFFAMVRYASNKGLQGIHVNTNLMAFRPEMLGPLLTSGIAEIVVGQDAVTDDRYAAIRRGGRLDVVRRNLFALLDERDRLGLDRPKISVQYIVMDENEDEAEAFVEEWRKAQRKVTLKIRRRVGWSYGLPSWRPVREMTKRESRIPCAWLLRQMTVFWDGRVPQCDGDYEGTNIVGQAGAQSLSDIWTGPLEDLRRRHQSLDFDFPPCRDCDDWLAGRSRYIEINPDSLSG